MPDLEVCEDASAWDAFVAQASDGSPLQAWAWGSLKSRYGWTVRRYALREGGTMAAGVSVLRRSLPGGLALHYAPRGPVLDGRLDLWPPLWEALRARLSRDGGTVLRLFRERGQACVYLARLDGRLLAGAVMIFLGRTLAYLFGATADEAEEHKPGYLLHWRAIQDAQTRGCSRYDMWGVPLDPQPSHPGFGYYTFKSRFNGEQVRFIGLFDLPVHRAAAFTLRFAERFARAGQPEFV